MMSHLVVEKKSGLGMGEEKIFWAVWSEKKKYNESDDRDRESVFVHLSCPNLKMSLLLCVT